MSPAARIRFLDRLARLYGIQTAYYDVNDQYRHSSPEALLALLRSLGAPVETAADVENAWREKQRDIWRQPLEPVSVVREGEPPQVEVRLHSSLSDTEIPCSLILENGDEHNFIWSAADTPVVNCNEVDGERYFMKYLPLNINIPLGYHTIIVGLHHGSEEGMLIYSPAKAYNADHATRCWWGIFLPLYSLHSKKSWGSGDYSDLEKFAGWVSEKGGDIIGTLPLLPTFTESEASNSPYLPVSRLTWNDFYLNIEGIPELSECPQAQLIMESESFRKTVQHLKDSELVNYRSEAELKRRVLKELSRFFFSSASHRLLELRKFVDENPAIEDYARFRAAIDKKQLPWRKWGEASRDGVLDEGDYYEEDKNYYLYAQWLAYQQINSAIKKAETKGVELYLDLPLGVHPDGYDVWHEPDNFIKDTATGSPPDTVFTKGQNWTFNPPHPQKIREQRYRYIISYLQHHMKQTGLLRIDHVMSLHRLFTIPAGFSAEQGIYLRYNANELYAILALESQRNKTVIVGEDLGTVPPYVKPAMNRNGFERMYVLHYELVSNKGKNLPAVPRNVVASLNTHDMYPFAACWQGLDTEHRFKLGLINNDQKIQEQNSRRVMRDLLARVLKQKGWLKTDTPDLTTALEASLSFLSASRAYVLLINLEDLWLETKPQNIPSTSTEYPNWRRRAAYQLDDFNQISGLQEILKKIDRLRHRESGNG